MELRSEMKMFKRGLSTGAMLSLERLARDAGENWWKEVLGTKDLLLAVRGEYLNAYVKGQSVFKIAFEKDELDGVQPRLAIHYKYLIKPSLEKKDPYISFDGKTFAVDPAMIVHTVYQSRLTLPQLIRTASRFAGAEKAGVHKIAQNEPKVVDLEVAFTLTGESDGPSAPRMDIAVLVPDKKDGVSLVFCEAKCADNKELWELEDESQQKRPTGPSERKIAVVAQIDKYQTFIRRENEHLAKAYTKVCKTLVHLNRQDPDRKLDDLIEKVASGIAKLSIHPHVYLLVYDFDDDQKKGAVQRRRDALRANGVRVIAKGDPKSFSLTRDIMRMEGMKLE